MEPIRIVLAELPRMLRDILHASLADEPDVELVGDASSLEELKGLVEQGGVDVVMLGLSDRDLPASHYELFDANARVRILAFAEHGRNAFLYELRPHLTVLGQGSPQDLIRVVRAQVRGGRNAGWMSRSVSVDP